MKVSVILAVSLLPLAAGGCAGMGGNSARAAAVSNAATPAAVSFTQADLNGDGRVTRREFELWTAANTRERDAFDAADTNLNGVLTLDEWQAMLSRPSAAAGGSRAPGARSR